MTLAIAALRALAAGALLTLAACGGSKGGDGTTLRIGDQLHALKSSLDVAGEGKPPGYTIEWANFVGGPPIIAAQTGGSLDVGWMAETPLIFAQAAGSLVKVIAVSKTIEGGGSPYALVVRPDSPYPQHCRPQGQIGVLHERHRAPLFRGAAAGGTGAVAEGH